MPESILDAGKLSLQKRYKLINNKLKTQSKTPASNRNIAKGVAWMMAFKFVDRGIGLVSTLLLVRLLAPNDFGLVAMATAVLAIIELMSVFGFDTALIQRQNSVREHYDTAWTFNVVFGLTIAMVLVSIASAVADFYQEPRLEMILRVFALGSMVSGFENIGTVTFRKELDFNKEFRLLFIKRIATFTVTISLALYLRSYWALVAGSVTGKFASVIISYLLHPFRPKISMAARKELMHFSQWIFVSNLIGVLQSKSIDFILGRTVGIHGLGIYSVAWEIAVLPSTELIAPLNRAVFPAYSRLSDDLEELSRKFLGIYGIICLIAFPIAFGLFSVAEPLVLLMLGDKWGEAVPIIQITATCGLFGALQSNLYLVIVALGKPKFNTLVSGILLMFSLPLIIVLSLRYGVFGASCAQLFSTVVGLISIMIIFKRVTRIAVGKLINVMYRPLLVSILLVLIVQALDQWLNTGYAGISLQLRLLILVSAGAISYISLILLIWLIMGRPNSAESSVVRLLQNQFARRTSA